MENTNLGGKLATAIGVSSGTEYQFTDRDGVTYTGKPPHVVLSAIARADVTPDLGFHEDYTTHLRGIAVLLATWFTCEEADPDDMAAFAALTPRAACEVVVRATVRGSCDTLAKVGDATVARYTDHLLNGGADDRFPEIIDEPLRPLSEARLDVTPTAADGVEAVELRVKVRARERRVWSLETDVSVPLDRLNHVLMHAGELEALVEIREPLLEGDLSRDSGFSEHMDVRVELAAEAPAGNVASRPTQRLLELAVRHGVDQADLDEMVSEVFDRRASAVNNEGLEAQIACLVEALDEREVAALIGASSDPAEGMG